MCVAVLVLALPLDGVRHYSTIYLCLNPLWRFDRVQRTAPGQSSQQGSAIVAHAIVIVLTLVVTLVFNISHSESKSQSSGEEVGLIPKAQPQSIEVYPEKNGL